MPDDRSVARGVEEFARRVEAGGAATTPVDPTHAMHRVLDDLRVAAANAHAGQAIPEGSRARVVKQAVVAGMRPVAGTQHVFNLRILEAVTQLGEVVVGLSDLVAELRAASGELRGRFDEVTVTHRADVTRMNRLDASLATIDVALDLLADDVRGLIGHSTGADGAAPAASVPASVADVLASDDSEPHAVPDPGRAAIEQLYQDFEDRFRGSRDEVMERLADYIGDIESTPGAFPAVDVGCGRGEWLEVLARHGVDAYGVDTSRTVVERCRALGFDARHDDAVGHLRTIGHGSVRAVTGFHIAEHLPFETLVDLVEAAFVALAPGGLLILETPNGTNVTVGAASFYLDPTHLRPLHPNLLEFLCHRQGFAEVEVRFLRRTREPVDVGAVDASGVSPWSGAAIADIDWAMFGPLDYAVVARKSTS